MTVAGFAHKMAEKKWTCVRCAQQLYLMNHRWYWEKTSPSPSTMFMTCPQHRIPSITPVSENLLMGKDFTFNHVPYTRRDGKCFFFFFGGGECVYTHTHTHT